jgi:hypothetical protein
MDTAQVIEHAVRLRERLSPYADDMTQGSPGEGAKAQVCEFLRIYAGPKSAFTKQAESVVGGSSFIVATLQSILSSFLDYLRVGLTTGISPERRAQVDVVSDILGQAQAMLEDERYHPAAAAVLIGASVEEFLRNWVEAEGVSIGNSKPGLDAYCKALKTADLLSKQDVKDITAWAGVRNHAAHGEWAQASDRERVRLMLEGVNLFMRQKLK